MKKLYRSRTEKMIFGVCGGIGEYFNVDPNVVRIGAILCGCAGFGLIAYFVCALIVPEQPVV
ncbi:MAG: PspC domain-containing protein [Clostridiales bacterium]|nr:PspC domain-containing protein [Clostridiales bacterium]